MTRHPTILAVLRPAGGTESIKVRDVVAAAFGPLEAAEDALRRLLAHDPDGSLHPVVCLEWHRRASALCGEPHWHAGTRERWRWDGALVAEAVSGGVSRRVSVDELRAAVGVA